MQDASSNQQTKIQPSHQQTGLPPHSAFPIRGKTENKQALQNPAQISPHRKLTETTGPTLGGQKPKGRKNSTFFKERIQLSLKPWKRNEKAVKYCTNEGTNRNTEVQTNEVEIDKLLEKEFRIMIVKMIKNLEN